MVKSFSRKMTDIDETNTIEIQNICLDNNMTEISNIQDESDDIQTECFICNEHCDTQTQCKCKNVYAHDTCILKMLSYAHNDGKCRICKEPYRNIKLRTKNVIRMTKHWRNITYIYILDSILLGFSQFSKRSPSPSISG